MKQHLPVLAAIGSANGLAFGLPIDEAVRRALSCAQSLSAAAEKAPARETFGQRLAQTVRRRVASGGQPRTAIFASAAVAPKAEEESFAERLKKEVEKRSGRKRNEEQAERERNRYPKQRQPTKGE
jgi:hypothetical protein